MRAGGGRAAVEMRAAALPEGGSIGVMKKPEAFPTHDAVLVLYYALYG